jgi:hypothetical protein
MLTQVPENPGFSTTRTTKHRMGAFPFFSSQEDQSSPSALTWKSHSQLGFLIYFSPAPTPIKWLNCLCNDSIETMSLLVSWFKSSSEINNKHQTLPELHQSPTSCDLSTFQETMQGAIKHPQNIPMPCSNMWNTVCLRTPKYHVSSYFPPTLPTALGERQDFSWEFVVLFFLDLKQQFLERRAHDFHESRCKKVGLWWQGAGLGCSKSGIVYPCLLPFKYPHPHSSQDQVKHCIWPTSPILDYPSQSP